MTINFDAPSGLSVQMLSQGSRREPDTDRYRGTLEWRGPPQDGPAIKRNFHDMPGSLLTKVIEGEIIPRLMLAHRATVRPAARQDKIAHIVSSEAFARMVLTSAFEEILVYVDSLLESGITQERLFLDLLAPGARKLGDLWEEDYCAFTDVAMALSRLHRVLHEIGRRNDEIRPCSLNYSAFFAPVPGETHTFGVAMLEEFFQHAGWQTSCDHAGSARGILHSVATKWHDIVGFSVSCQELLEPLSDLIHKTHKTSCNRDVVIMVGGGLFIDRRDLAARFGHATIVTDGLKAVQVAGDMVSRLRQHGEAQKIV